MAAKQFEPTEIAQLRKSDSIPQYTLQWQDNGGDIGTSTFSNETLALRVYYQKCYALGVKTSINKRIGAHWVTLRNRSGQAVGQ